MHRNAARLIALILIAASPACTADFPRRDSEQPVVKTPATIYFAAPEGAIVTVEPGTYTVSQSEGSIMVAAKGKPSLRLPGKYLKHPVHLKDAQALLLDQGEELRSLVLLLPNGTGLEAIGSRSAAPVDTARFSSRGLQLDVAASQLFVRNVFDSLRRPAAVEWLPSDHVGHVASPYDPGGSAATRPEQTVLIYRGTEVSAQLQELRGLVDVFDLSTRADCSGVLLTRDIVLTAGHCISDARRPELVNVHAAWDRPDKKLNAAYAEAIYHFSDGFDLRGPDLALIRLKYPGIFASSFYLNVPFKGPLTVGLQFTAYGQGMSSVYDPVTGTAPSGSGTWRKADFTVASIIQTLLYGDELYFFTKNIFQQVTLPGDSGGPDFMVKSGQPFILGIHSRASGATCADINNCAATITLPQGGKSVSVPRFRDWIIHVPPQCANCWWDPNMPAFPVLARLSEVKGVRSSITDVNHTTWAEAGRTGNTMCFNRGFVTGHLDGYQDGWDWGDDSMSFGVLCSGPGVAWRDVTSPQIASTGWGFTDVNQVHWAQAQRAAAGLCAATVGYAGGRFNGHQKNDLHGLVCYSKDIAQRFDASTGILERIGHTIGDLNTTPWEVAARAAKDYCRTRGPDIYKTYQGGFFTGHQQGNVRGVVCLRTKATCLLCYARVIDTVRLSP